MLLLLLLLLLLHDSMHFRPSQWREITGGQARRRGRGGGVRGGRTNPLGKSMMKDLKYKLLIFSF